MIGSVAELYYNFDKLLDNMEALGRNVNIDKRKKSA